MPTNKPRVTFALSEGQLERLEDYRIDQRIKNQSQAILSLIEKGLSDIEKNGTTSKEPPEEKKKFDELVKKYRLLDHEWQEAVDSVLDIGYRQCKERQKQAAILRDKREQVEISEETAPVVILHQPYAQVAAAEGAGAFLLDDGYDEVSVEMNEFTKRADVILKVVGRSMEPVIADGDRVLIRMQPSVKIGEIGVFIIDGQGYLKEYQADKLVSLNPAIEDIYIGDLQCAECYGKFIEVLKPDWVK